MLQPYLQIIMQCIVKSIIPIIIPLNLMESHGIVVGSFQPHYNCHRFYNMLFVVLMLDTPAGQTSWYWYFFVLTYCTPTLTAFPA